MQRAHAASPCSVPMQRPRRARRRSMNPNSTGIRIGRCARGHVRCRTCCCCRHSSFRLQRKKKKNLEKCEWTNALCRRRATSSKDAAIHPRSRSASIHPSIRARARCARAQVCRADTGSARARARRRESACATASLGAPPAQPARRTSAPSAASTTDVAAKIIMAPVKVAVIGAGNRYVPPPTARLHFSYPTPLA